MLVILSFFIARAF